jgi:hypothetical protein
MERIRRTKVLFLFLGVKRISSTKLSLEEACADVAYWDFFENRRTIDLFFRFIIRCNDKNSLLVFVELKSLFDVTDIEEDKGV